jgi:hypothetical protein
MLSMAMAYRWQLGIEFRQLAINEDARPSRLSIHGFDDRGASVHDRPPTSV